MDREQKFKEYSLALAEINKQLKKLEEEKQILIKSFEMADDKERKKITDKMKKSEEKFKKLYKLTLDLSAKVKELKNNNQ